MLIEITNPIDPVAISLFGLNIYWYSLAYIVGVVSAWFLLKYTDKRQALIQNTEAIIIGKIKDNLITVIIIGILLGGRLGYVLFYNIEFYLNNPSEIYKVWQGGMSFHGGLIGAIIGIYLFSHINKLPFLKITDQLALLTPIGIFFGRIANFINNELVGRVTNNENFGVIFPNDIYPRHPSQLYEAFLEGIILFIILNYLAFKTKIFTKTGYISGLFLIFYAIFRIIVEFFREPDAQLGFLFSYFTMGQILSLIMLISGLFIINLAKRK